MNELKGKERKGRGGEGRGGKGRGGGGFVYTAPPLSPGFVIYEVT